MLGQFLDRVKSGLARTRDALSDGIAAVVGGRRLDDDMVDEIEAVLLQADVGLDTATEIVDLLRERVGREEIGAEAVTDLL